MLGGHAMPTKKFAPSNHIAYDKVPVQLKVLPGVRERLKDVRDWRGQVRDFIDSLIAANQSGSGPD
jgi:hypothetical protein